MLFLLVCYFFLFLAVDVDVDVDVDVGGQMVKNIIKLKYYVTMWCIISFQSRINNWQQIFYQWSYHSEMIFFCWVQTQRKVHY